MQGGQHPSPLSLSGLTQLLSQTQQALAAGLPSPPPLPAGEPLGTLFPSPQETQCPASQPSGSSVFLQAAPQLPMSHGGPGLHHAPLGATEKPPQPASALQQPWPRTQASPDAGIASAAQPSSAPQRAQQQQPGADAAHAWQQEQGQQQQWRQEGARQAPAADASKAQAYSGVHQQQQHHQHPDLRDLQDREQQVSGRAAAAAAPEGAGARQPQGGKPAGGQAVGSGAGAGGQQGAGVAKERMRWTEELHSRFVRAVGMLGGATKAKVSKNHVPKDIMDVMRVPGLGLNHIKRCSHLQKYRSYEGQLPDAQTPTGASSASVYRQHLMPGGSLAGHKRVWREEAPDSPAVQSRAPPPHAAAAAAPAPALAMAPPPPPPPPAPPAAEPAVEAGRSPGPGAPHAPHAVAPKPGRLSCSPLPDPPHLPPAPAQQYHQHQQHHHQPQQQQQQQVQGSAVPGGGELAASLAAALPGAPGRGPSQLQLQLSQVMLYLGVQAPAMAPPGALGGGAAAGDAALGPSTAWAGQAGPQAQGSSPSWQQTQYGKQAQQQLQWPGSNPAGLGMRQPGSPSASLGGSSGSGGGSLLELLHAAMVLQHTAVQHLQAVAMLQGDLRGRLQRQIQLEREFDEQLGLHIGAVQTLMAHCLSPLVSHLAALSRACTRVVGAAEAKAQKRGQAQGQGGGASLQGDGHDKRQRQGEVRGQAVEATDRVGNTSWGAAAPGGAGTAHAAKPPPPRAEAQRQHAAHQAVQQAPQRGQGPAQGAQGQSRRRVVGPGEGDPASRSSPRPSSESLSLEGATYFPYPAAAAAAAAASADPLAAVPTGQRPPAGPWRPTAHRVSAASIPGRAAARQGAATPPFVPVARGAEPAG